MDRELDQQIDDIISKTTKDLKTKIERVIVRHQNKLIKDHARELKSVGNSVHKIDRGKSTKQSASSKQSTSSKQSKKYYTDSESDYYSE